MDLTKPRSVTAIDDTVSEFLHLIIIMMLLADQHHRRQEPMTRRAQGLLKDLTAPMPKSTW